VIQAKSQQCQTIVNVIFLITDQFSLISLSKISHVKILTGHFRDISIGQRTAGSSDLLIKVKDQTKTRKEQTEVVGS